MSYLDKSILEIHQLLLEGKVTPLDLVKEAIEKAKTDDNNAFEYICEKEALEAVSHLDESKKNNLLWGIPYVLKDNFSTKDIPTTASSNILNGYVPVYSSEVYLRLAEQGAILIGKTTLDELGMGGSGMAGHLGKTFNPWDKSHKRMVGGSSCGSAAAESAGIVPFAIGSDTGDSVRKPASHSGTVGFKPTWGRISRFGLFPFAPSLDHVGFFTRNVLDSAIILQTLAGRDEKDMTSSEREVPNYVGAVNRNIEGMSIAIIDEIYGLFTDEIVRSAFEKTLLELASKGVKINHVHMDSKLCQAIYPTYIVLSSAEATSNDANLDGIKFGTRFEGEDYQKVMMKARTQGFSELIKRRFVIGSYSLLRENQNEVFLRAQKCRRLIVNAINDILKDNDAIYLPAAPDIAPYFSHGASDWLNKNMIVSNNYLAFANFGGQPSITVPIGFKDGMPFGANLTGKIFDEENVLALAKNIEDITGLKDLVAGKER